MSMYNSGIDAHKTFFSNLLARKLATISLRMCGTKKLKDIISYREFPRLQFFFEHFCQIARSRVVGLFVNLRNICNVKLNVTVYIEKFLAIFPIRYLIMYSSIQIKVRDQSTRRKGNFDFNHDPSLLQ